MDENPGKPPEWVTLVGVVPRFDGLGVVYGLRLPKEPAMLSQSEEQTAAALIRVLMDSGISRDEAIKALAAAFAWNLQRVK